MPTMTGIQSIKKNIQIDSMIKLIHSKRLRMAWIKPSIWIDYNHPIWAWFYCFTNHESSKGDHVLQLTLIGLNIALRHKIIDRP